MTERMLALAIDAAREAGAIAMRHFRADPDTWDKGPGQVVTQADIEIDRHLHDRLMIDPATAWLSEETEDDLVRLKAERLWIVDPIDGTRSFVEGRPEFTISIALADRSGPLVGVVFNPATGQLYEAARGAGARLNGASLTMPARSGIDGASIVVSAGENRRRNFAAMFTSAEVTTVGSLAYKLARVAASDFDAFFSWRKANDWDIAAAALILAEAGGELSDANGEPIRLNDADTRHQGLIAAASPLHGELVRHSRERLAAGR
ncbi:MAG: 3'(2'),5'-bisphosphate nucleotidase CysQ [Geminicoccaceae bacterium]|nr:3'(2'),5'-bisphosphate nucleotidase CysQ [Geminicoccaceae bacterium]